MSQGIVVIEPRGTQKGSLKVTLADPNPYRVAKDSPLGFLDPMPLLGFSVYDKQTVEFDILDETTCKITRVY